MCCKCKLEPKNFDRHYTTSILVLVSVRVKTPAGFWMSNPISKEAVSDVEDNKVSMPNLVAAHPI